MATEKELVDFVAGIIQNGDLNSLTFTKIFEQLQEKFPNEDLSERKKFLRSTVKELVQEEQQRQEEKTQDKGKGNGNGREKSKDRVSSSPSIAAAPKKRTPQASSPSLLKSSPSSASSSKKRKTSDEEGEQATEAPSSRSQKDQHENGKQESKSEESPPTKAEEPKEEIPYNVDGASEEEKKLQALLFEAYRFGVSDGARSTRAKRKLNNTEEKKKKKQATQGEEGEEEEGSNPKPAKKRRPMGPAKPHVLSPAMADFLGVEPEDQMTRTEVVKRLHAYIKEHELQNPKNKREILFDQKLQDVFKVRKSDYFKINKLISIHVKPADEVV